MTTRIQLKRGQTSEWAGGMLQEGEPGLDLTTGTLKIGGTNGTSWNSSFVVGSGGSFGGTLGGSTGPTGSVISHTGPTGPAGSAINYTGPTGPAGNGTAYTGPTGSGLTGPTGPAGPAGNGTAYTGPTGLMGPTGSGITGATGPAGPAGNGTAYTGPTGLMGPTGSGITGATGPAGNGTAYTGPTGLMGPTGSGLTGPTGPAGNGTAYTGPTGPGVPTGGVTGYVLTKRTGTDYDTIWSAPSGGGGSYGLLKVPAAAGSFNFLNAIYSGSSAFTYTSSSQTSDGSTFYLNIANPVLPFIFVNAYIFVGTGYFNVQRMFGSYAGTALISVVPNAALTRLTFNYLTKTNLPYTTNDTSGYALYLYVMVL